jgi:hypothetical protein
MADIGKPVRRETVVPLTQPVRAPEPKEPPLPERREPVRREEERELA